MERSSTVGRVGQGLSPRDDFPLASRTGYLLSKATMLITEDAEDALEAVGMRLRYFFVLTSLAGGPELSQQDLSRLLNLDPTTVVALIDEMERNEHVERRRNPADRRRYNLVLTESGRAALAAAEQVVTDTENAFFGSLAGPERAGMQDMLARLLAGRWPSSVC